MCELAQVLKLRFGKIHGFLSQAAGLEGRLGYSSAGFDTKMESSPRKLVEYVKEQAATVVTAVK